MKSDIEGEVKRYCENTNIETMADEFERLLFFYRSGKVQELEQELIFLNKCVDNFVNGWPVMESIRNKEVG